MKNEPARSDSYTDILRRAGRESLEVESQLKEPEENKKLTFQSFGADFVEVKIDPLLPRVQVTRVVSVINCGRVVTFKPARNQIIGGVNMGIGMVLVLPAAHFKKVQTMLDRAGEKAFTIGRIVKGERKVQYA